MKNSITGWVSGLSGVYGPNSELVAVQAAHKIPKYYWGWPGQSHVVLVDRLGQQHVLCYFTEKYFLKEFAVFSKLIMSLFDIE